MEDLEEYSVLTIKKVKFMSLNSETKKQEYLLKLKKVLGEIESKCIMDFKNGEENGYFIKIDHAINEMDRQFFRGKLISGKSHGLNAASLIVNQIINKC